MSGPEFIYNNLSKPSANNSNIEKIDKIEDVERIDKFEDNDVKPPIPTQSAPSIEKPVIHKDISEPTTEPQSIQLEPQSDQLTPKSSDFKFMYDEGKSSQSIPKQPEKSLKDQKSDAIKKVFKREPYFRLFKKDAIIV